MESVPENMRRPDRFPRVAMLSWDDWHENLIEEDRPPPSSFRAKHCV